DPEVEVDKVPDDDGEALEFHYEIGVRPQATLGEYRELEVAMAEPDVPDDIIDREDDRLREELARLETVERAAAEGDIVLIDFVGSIDGEPFEGGAAEDYTLELGSNQLIEGFEDQLDGAKAGDEVDVGVTFPDEYGAEQLAGKDVL